MLFKVVLRSFGVWRFGGDVKKKDVQDMFLYQRSFWRWLEGFWKGGLKMNKNDRVAEVDEGYWLQFEEGSANREK